MKTGKLFVIDGTDGSGKQTQLQKLKERFAKERIEYKAVSFPNYDSPSSSLVKMYLAGKFGSDSQAISPYIASTFFAVDRYATFKKDYENYYNNGGIILADRYTTSNMVHQAGKIKDDVERAKFLDWLWNFEFGLYGLPVPTKVIFLNMPTEYAQKLMQNRENKITHEDKKDIHESNTEHLKAAYTEACKLVKKYDWCEIHCVENDRIKSIDEIHEEVFNEVKKYI